EFIKSRLLLPSFPVFQPLVRVPIELLTVSKNVGVHEGAWPPPFWGQVIGTRVQLEGKAKRHRLLARRFLPALVAGKPAAAVGPERNHVPAGNLLLAAVIDRH